MNDLRFISIDGNNIGKRIEQYILSEQFDALRSFSDCVSTAISKVSHFIVGLGGTVLMSGGDNLLATVPQNECHSIIRFLTQIQTKGIPFAMGIGHNARASFLALKYAKATESNCIVYEEVFSDACI